jgi:hypothetical protein
MRRADSELWRRPLNDADRARIDEVEASLLQSGVTPSDGLALSDLEERLDSILRSYGQSDTWELSAGLANCNMPPETLTSLLTHFDPGTARAALMRIVTSAELSRLLSILESSTTQISNLVQNVKEYTYMDQATVQKIDVARSLETTLGTLAHLLQPGIRVRRAYEPTPLLVRT